MLITTNLLLIMPNHTMRFFYITFTSAVGKFHFFCRQFCLLPVGRLRRVPYCHSQKQPRSALFLFFFYPLSHKCGGDKRKTASLREAVFARWCRKGGLVRSERRNSDCCERREPIASASGKSPTTAIKKTLAVSRGVAWCRWSDSNRHGFYSTGF